MRARVLSKIDQEKSGNNKDVNDQDSINEYQISDFIKSEWNFMAKTASKLVTPNIADRYQ